MTSDEIFAAIEEIAATPGKNDKIALVTKHSADPEFVRVLKATYNPLITYGVRKFPAGVEKYADGTFDEGVWEMLDRLANRTLTGNAALESIAKTLGVLSANSGTLLKRIILGDMRAGFDAETCNKAVKGMVPVFPYMRCSLPKHVDLDEFFKDGCAAQEKADGMFMNLDVTEGGEVRLSSRQGTQYQMGGFEAFAAVVRATIKPGTQTHGEMLVLRDGVICERQDGNGVLNHVAAGGDFAENEQPLYLAWDQIPLSAVVPKGKYKVPYRQRLAGLIGQFKANPNGYIRLIETVIVKNMKEAMAFYSRKLREGKEGAIVKKLTAIWKDGTSKEQIKLKLKVPFEARVKGFNYGSGKNEGKISSLQCASECEALEFDVSCRGDAMIAAVTANPDDWLDAIVTCEGNDVMEPSESNPKHSIYLPIFVERRTDKSEADTLVRIKEQFAAAVEA